MAVVQLRLGSEFEQVTLPFKDQIRELLASQEPVFFKYVEHYEKISFIAQKARDDLSKILDRSDPASVNEDAKLTEDFLLHAQSSPNHPRVLQYKEREKLREEVGLLIDAEYIIRKNGNKLAASLKKVLGPGVYEFGSNYYFIEVDPRQSEYPGRRNFYLLKEGEEYPIGFGNDVRFDAIQEPILPASPADIVALMRDLQDFTGTGKQR